MSNQRNIFRRALREVQGGSAFEPSTHPKVSDATNATEESLVAGYQSSRSPFDKDYAPPKKKASKKPLTNEKRLDNVIASENANVWQRLQFASEAKEKRERAKFQKEMEGEANAKTKR